MASKDMSYYSRLCLLLVVLHTSEAIRGEGSTFAGGGSQGSISSGRRGGSTASHSYRSVLKAPTLKPHVASESGSGGDSGNQDAHEDSDGESSFTGDQSEMDYHEGVYLKKQTFNQDKLTSTLAALVDDVKIPFTSREGVTLAQMKELTGRLAERSRQLQEAENRVLAEANISNGIIHRQYQEIKKGEALLSEKDKKIEDVRRKFEKETGELKGQVALYKGNHEGKEKLLAEFRAKTLEMEETIKKIMAEKETVIREREASLRELAKLKDEQRSRQEALSDLSNRLQEAQHGMEQVSLQNQQVQKALEKEARELKLKTEQQDKDLKTTNEALLLSKKSIEEKEALLDSYQKQLSEKDTEMSGIKRDKEALLETIRKTQENLESLTADKAKTLEEMATLKALGETLAGEIADTKKQILDSQKNNEQLELTLKTTMVSTADKQLALEKLEEANKKKEAEKKALEQKVSEKEKEKLALERTLKEKSLEEQRKNDAITRFSQTVAEQKKLLSDYASKVSGLEKERGAQQRSLEKGQQTVRETAKELLAERERASALQTAKDAAESSFQQLQNELEKKSREVVENQSLLKEQATVFKTLESTNSSLQKMNNDLLSKNADVERTLEGIQKTHAVAVETLNAQTREIKEIHDKNRQLLEQISLLREENTSLAGENTYLEKEKKHADIRKLVVSLNNIFDATKRNTTTIEDRHFLSTMAVEEEKFNGIYDRLYIGDGEDFEDINSKLTLEDLTHYEKRLLLIQNRVFSAINAYVVNYIKANEIKGKFIDNNRPEGYTQNHGIVQDYHDYLKAISRIKEEKTRRLTTVELRKRLFEKQKEEKEIERLIKEFETIFQATKANGPLLGSPFLLKMKDYEEQYRGFLQNHLYTGGEIDPALSFGEMNATINPNLSKEELMSHKNTLSGAYTGLLRMVNEGMAQYSTQDIPEDHDINRPFLGGEPIAITNGAEYLVALSKINQSQTAQEKIARVKEQADRRVELQQAEQVDQQVKFNDLVAKATNLLETCASTLKRYQTLSGRYFDGIEPEVLPLQDQLALLFEKNKGLGVNAFNTFAKAGNKAALLEELHQHQEECTKLARELDVALFRRYKHFFSQILEKTQSAKDFLFTEENTMIQKALRGIIPTSEEDTEAQKSTLFTLVETLGERYKNLLASSGSRSKMVEEEVAPIGTHPILEEARSLQTSLFNIRSEQKEIVMYCKDHLQLLGFSQEQVQSELENSEFYQKFQAFDHFVGTMNQTFNNVEAEDLQRLRDAEQQGRAFIVEAFVSINTLANTTVERMANLFPQDSFSSVDIQQLNQYQTFLREVNGFLEGKRPVVLQEDIQTIMKHFDALELETSSIMAAAEYLTTSLGGTLSSEARNGFFPLEKEKDRLKAMLREQVNHNRLTLYSLEVLKDLLKRSYELMETQYNPLGLSVMRGMLELVKTQIMQHISPQTVEDEFRSTFEALEGKLDNPSGLSVNTFIQDILTMLEKGKTATRPDTIQDVLKVAEVVHTSLKKTFTQCELMQKRLQDMVKSRHAEAYQDQADALAKTLATLRGERDGINGLEATKDIIQTKAFLETLRRIHNRLNGVQRDQKSLQYTLNNLETPPASA